MYLFEKQNFFTGVWIWRIRSYLPSSQWCLIFIYVFKNYPSPLVVEDLDTNWPKSKDNFDFTDLLYETRNKFGDTVLRIALRKLGLQKRNEISNVHLYEVLFIFVRQEKFSFSPINMFMVNRNTVELTGWGNIFRLKF